MTLLTKEELARTVATQAAIKALMKAQSISPDDLRDEPYTLPTGVPASVYRERKVWRPGNGQDYFFISDAGDADEDHWEGSFSDFVRLHMGNVFQTEHDAIAAEARLHAVVRGAMTTDSSKTKPNRPFGKLALVTRPAGQGGGYIGGYGKNGKLLAGFAEADPNGAIWTPEEANEVALAFIACWNACAEAGLTVEQLNGGVITQMMAENDALKAALAEAELTLDTDPETDR